MINANTCLAYKGYLGSVEYCAESHMLHGKILGIESLLMYDGRSLDELVADMQEVVDYYLSWCEEEGQEPNKPLYKTEGVLS